MSKRLDSRKTAYKNAIEKYGQDSYEANLAYARVAIAQKDYDATPEGLDVLTKRLQTEDDENLQARLDKATLTRELQANALAEIRNGRFDAIVDAYASINKFYDRDEIYSLVESSREYKEQSVLYGYGHRKGDPDERYQTAINRLEEVMTEANNGNLTPEQEAALNKLRSMPAPDMATLEAYENVPRVLQKSKGCLDQQITNVSALQNTSPKIIQAYYDEYREQYKTEFAHLDAANQPNPPEAWIRGEFRNSGYAQERSSRFAPHDKASMYAMYRLRSDENAIPDYMKQSKIVASIDLETTGVDNMTVLLIDPCCF